MTKYDPHPVLTGIGDENLESAYRAARRRSITEYLQDEGGAAFRAGQFVLALRGDARAARWCRDGGLVFAKAQSTGVSAAGGVLVPQQVADDITSVLEAYGTARRLCRRWPMTSDNLPVPRLTDSVAVSFGGDGLTGTISGLSLDGITLTPKKASGYLTLSSELAEDAENLGRAFLIAAAQAFHRTEDDVLFAADGSSTYAGMSGIGTALSSGLAGHVTAGHSTFGTLDAADIGSLIGAVAARAWQPPGPNIFCHPQAFGLVFARLGGASGGALSTGIGPDGRFNACWNGLPIEFCPSLPSDSGSLSGKMMLACGNLQQATAFGLRRDMAIAEFQETRADADEILLRTTERFHIVVHDVGDDSAGGSVAALYGA
jgi:HK97 family phage major capsid protein